MRVIGARHNLPTNIADKTAVESVSRSSAIAHAEIRKVNVDPVDRSPAWHSALPSDHYDNRGFSHKCPFDLTIASIARSAIANELWSSNRAFGLREMMHRGFQRRRISTREEVFIPRNDCRITKSNVYLTLHKCDDQNLNRLCRYRRTLQTLIASLDDFHSAKVSLYQVEIVFWKLVIYTSGGKGPCPWTRDKSNYLKGTITKGL